MQENHLTFNQGQPGPPGAGRPAWPEVLAADAFRHAAAEAELLRVRLGQLQGGLTASPTLSMEVPA